MNRQMPSKGSNPSKHNRSVAKAKLLVKDCNEALARPNLPRTLRIIIKGYKTVYSKSENRKSFSGFVRAA